MSFSQDGHHPGCLQGLRHHLNAAALALAVLLSLLPVQAAQAQGKPLPDVVLSEVWGQAMVEVTNTSVNGYDFSKVTLNADITLSANFTNIRLGEYTSTTRNGTGADIAISTLQFGRSDLGDAQRTVTLNNPYMEMVYSGSGSTRQVIGMRLGFEGITGSLGISAQSISGSVAVTDSQGRTLDSRTDTLGGKRWDGTTCGSAACPFSLADITAIQAGNASGASRDFFISVLKSTVQYPTSTGMTTASDAAQAGVWLNWRDRLAATLGTTIPANVAKPGG
ncbi:hypothetical protein [Roseateles koreensis]|uniref:Porin n=1 Tax=Roseateles koreensis TaxID=2987526 RepID=A0ABT5KRG4_9BURK|nr:hypothetical protein [Roseateles koreensis]MDC8785035.1 hypothetical protein [Roseateles koreensis]